VPPSLPSALHASSSIHPDTVTPELKIKAGFGLASKAHSDSIARNVLEPHRQQAYIPNFFFDNLIFQNFCMPFNLHK
jgi:hypothetical protein